MRVGSDIWASVRICRICYFLPWEVSNAGGRFAPNFAALPNDVILVLYPPNGGFL